MSSFTPTTDWRQCLFLVLQCGRPVCGWLDWMLQLEFPPKLVTQIAAAVSELDLETCRSVSCFKSRGVISAKLSLLVIFIKYYTTLYLFLHIIMYTIFQKLVLDFIFYAFMRNLIKLAASIGLSPFMSNRRYISTLCKFNKFNVNLFSNWLILFILPWLLVLSQRVIC